MALRRRKGAELHSGGVEYEGVPRHHKGGVQGMATKRERMVLPFSQKETGVTSGGQRVGTWDSVTTTKRREDEVGT